MVNEILIGGPNAERFHHILTGHGPDWLYAQGCRFEMLCSLAPPAELLDALTRQQERGGTVPPATAQWLKRWRALERAQPAQVAG